MSTNVPNAESLTATSTEALTPTVTTAGRATDAPSNGLNPDNAGSTKEATTSNSATNNSTTNNGNTNNSNSNSDIINNDNTANNGDRSDSEIHKEPPVTSSAKGSIDSTSDEMQDKQYPSISHEEAQKRRNRRFLCYGVVAVATLIAIGIVLGIAFGKEGRASQAASKGDKGDREPTGAPSAAPVLNPYIPEVTSAPSLRPTTAPTGSPTSVIEALLVSSGIALQGGSEFQDETSPQAQSLAWLESTALRTWSNAKVFRRYILGCIYFGTQAVTTASTIVFYESTEAPPQWLNSTGWTTGEEECTWHGITCNENGDISGISLPNNRLSGKMPNEITILRDTLIELDLTSNIIENVGQSGLAWIGELTKLQYLYIGGNYFGYFGLPPFLGELTDLRELDVSYCSFHGPMNAELIFSKTRKLHYLEMGGNGYNSSIPDVIIDLPELERLYMDNAFLSGDLSWLSFDRVPFLFELWIDDNAGMTATIPSSIGTLSNTLASLSLTSTTLKGNIPTELGLVTSMVQLWLYDNELEGVVPTEMRALSDLRTFHIQGNPLLTGDNPVCDSNPALVDMGANCDVIGCGCCTCCSMQECGTGEDNEQSV